jgi:hypothetical protein
MAAPQEIRIKVDAGDLKLYGAAPQMLAALSEMESWLVQLSEEAARSGTATPEGAGEMHRKVYEAIVAAVGE